MKKFVLACGAALAVAISAPAYAFTGWYASGDLGSYWRQPSDGKVGVLIYQTAQPDFLEPATLRRSLSFDPGITGHLALGFHVRRHVRVEAEIGYAGYASNQFEVFNPDPHTAIQGSIQRDNGSHLYRRFTQAVNVFYDVRSVLGVTPYLGGGLGIQEYHSTSNSYGYGAAGDILVPGGSGVVGFGQVEVGLTLHATRRLSVSPAYRYVRTFGPQSNPATGFGSDTTPNNGDRSGDVAHVFKVGLRYDF